MSIHEPTVTLRQQRYQGVYSYRVVQTTNTTDPKLGEELRERDVKDLIGVGVKVTVLPPKS